MKDITVSHDMAHIGPMKSVPLIRPVCTPLCADTRFPDEIRSHASSSVYSLWERLGLVYLDEEKPETPQTSNSVIVNNFTQQIVFQLFSQKNISRLIDSNQPGFVLLDKVYREAENGRRSSGKRISALLEKRRAEKSALIRELEGVLMTFSGSRREEAAASVSGELAGAAAAAILRKAAAEKMLTERQVKVSERLLESTTHREKTRALLKELSEQIKRGGEGSLVLTESIIGQISDVLRTESVPVRTGFMRAAAEKAAELVGQDITRDEARQTALAAVSKIFRDDLSDGTANAEQIGTVGTLGTVIPAEERSYFHDTNGAEVGAALPSGEYRAAGRVVRNSPGYLSGAALFLVERAEEELDTGKADGARLSRLSEQELKRVLTETAERNITEIQRTGVTDIAKTVSEAVRAAVSMKQSGAALPARNTRESRQADGGSADRTMPAALMRRAAGYVSDKLQYERRSGLSQLSSDRGSAFTEYRLLERADRILPKNVTVGTTLSGNDHLLSNSSGVYHAVSVDKANRGGDSVSAVRASGGQSFSGEAKPVQGDYTVNSTELNYTENREDNRNIQNNFSKSGDIRNIQNISGDTINQNTAAPVGEAKPVQGDYTANSTELNYTENREETRNIQNNFSKSGDIRNIQNISGDTINQNTAAPVGEAKPVQGDYTVNSTELNYTENREETRNIQNDFSKSGDIRNMQNISGDTINQNTAPVGEAKPVQGDYTVNSTELNYTENREETRSVQNNFSKPGDIRNIQNISGDTINQSANAPIGETKPVQGDYTVNSTELNYIENREETRNVQNNFNKSGDIRNIQNISGDTINQNTAPVGEAKPVQGDYTVNSTELNYIENREETRNIQNDFSKSGDIRNMQNISGDTINQNTTAAPVGEAKPVQGDYTANSTELTYMESIGDGGISAADSRRPAGHAVPFYGKRSRALSKGSVNGAEQSLPQERGRVIPADVIPKLSFDIGEAANVAAVGNEPSSPERADISYRSEPDIFRSSQRGTQNSAQGISRSYRDKLDSRTLEELDKMLSRAHAADADNSRGSEIPAAASGRVKAETGRVSAADNELIFTEEAPEIQPGSMVSAAVLPGTIGGTEMRILLGQIRNAARLRSAITTERSEARHISRLIRSIEEQEAVQNGEMTFSRSSYSFRTVDDGENMVMLIPPTEMDRYSAESGYARQLPPIEYKQREEQAQEQKPSGKPKVINNTQSSVRSLRSAVSGGFENMTREEINKLADMVYDQIQTRVMRERRRIGM